MEKLSTSLIGEYELKNDYYYHDYKNDYENIK